MPSQLKDDSGQTKKTRNKNKTKKKKAPINTHVDAQHRIKGRGGKIINVTEMVSC